MPLTDKAILKAKPTTKARKLFDGGGLYIEVAPSGGKLWRLKYRFDGREKRLAFGTYPDTSLEVAREKRDMARAMLTAGGDPGEHHKAEKAAACAIGKSQPRATCVRLESCAVQQPTSVLWSHLASMSWRRVLIAHFLLTA